MSAIRITRKLDSDRLHLPELKPLIGKNVEIIVQEAQPLGVIPGTGDWEAAARAAQELRETGYDFDAWREQREYDTASPPK
ncbi:MAG: hypothetical protein KY476_08725 [Planctomycetes bacterium]|nr:hypothetical protein [Planctomycetota bacterium]